MASGRLFLPGWMPARDSDGDPIPNVSVFFYQNGTDVLASVYADSALTIALSNPVPANSSGRFPQIYASDAITYSASVEAPYGPAGQPFTFDGLIASQAADIAAANLAQGAAEDAEAALQATLDAIEAATEAGGGSAAVAGAIAGTTAALAVVANRVRFDAPQVLGDSQKIQALANIDGQRTAFAASDETVFRSVEARITETKVLSTAYGADPTGAVSSTAGLQRIIDNLTAQAAKIVIPKGTWVFQTTVNIPDGKRILIECDPAALITTTNNIPILKYARPVAGTGTELWIRGGLWVYGGVAKSGGKAIEFKGRSITEHNNAVYIASAEFRYFAKSIDLAYTRGTISDIKGLENGNTIYGGPDASFVNIRYGFDQNSDVPIRFTGTGEAAGISNGLHISHYYSVGSKNRDVWITLYDLVKVIDCSGDLGGTVGVSGDAAVYFEQCTHFEISGGYWTSRGTSFNYGSPRIARRGIYLENCWGGQVEGNDIAFNAENIRIFNATPAGVYFGNIKVVANNFESTTGNAVNLNTSLHIIGLGVETLLIQGNTFAAIPDFNTGAFRSTFYGSAAGSKAWKAIGNFMADAVYTVSLGTGNMEDLNNTWSARVAQ